MRLFDYSTISVEAYKSFKKEHKKTPLTSKEFRSCLDELNHQLGDYLIESGKSWKFPYGLGTVFLQKKNTNREVTLANGEKRIKRKPDWAKTMKLWSEDPESKEAKKVIFHTNYHSDGYLAYLEYHNTRVMSENDCWQFTAGRTFKRKLAKKLLTDNTIISKYKLKTR